MDDFIWLTTQFRMRYPGSGLKVDLPQQNGGFHWADIKFNGKHLTLQWKLEQGFGFFAKDASYGERPEVIIKDRDAALQKVLDYFTK